MEKFIDVLLTDEKSTYKNSPFCSIFIKNKDIIAQAVQATPRSVAVGDFDGDSKLDLAVANFNSNNVSILLGTGTGSFGTAANFAVGTIPLSVAVGYFG
ncbi:MAG TPA: FG-GAP repeat protein [Candidatus Nitrosotenuis sp.]|nr:FG-GAP repeat protein [Candidatus Nitrosotenuis sp.]